MCHATRSQSREQRPPPQEEPPVIIEPLRIEYPFQEDPPKEPMATPNMAQCSQAPHTREQDEWLDDIGEESDKQELEAQYMYMEKIQEVLQAIDDKYWTQHYEQPESIDDTYVVETVNSNVIPDSSDMCNNEFEDDQNADDHGDKRVVFVNLIANLKLDTDENKKI
ncbi:hypothetical protein Tco_0960577 [Tanacetum coccineum]